MPLGDTGTRVLDRIAMEVSADPRSSSAFSRFEHSSSRIDFHVPLLGSSVTVAVYLAHGSLSVGLRGTTPTARRWLNDMVIGYSRLELLNDGAVIHSLSVSVSMSDVTERVFDAASKVATIRATEESGAFELGSTASLYWSSGVLNFGDWCGPHIVQRLSGRIPVQGNRPGVSPRIVYSVGSILGWIKRSNVDVWGSGLMRPYESDEIPARKRLNGVVVHAVRGTLTQNCVSDQIGWNVPDVFGDPALLLPQVYTPKSVYDDKIAFVPHGIHREAMIESDPSELRIVDVRKDFRDVVDSIVSSRAVVSTSLHGLVIAQAFGVPWVWLQLRDKPLMGGRFKFDDFFTNLSGAEPAEESADTDALAALDIERVAESATLPVTHVDLSKLASSLPITPLTRPIGHATSQSLD